MTQFKHLTRPELIIYDWDNTIVDTSDVITNVVNRLRADIGKPPLGNAEILDSTGDPDCEWVIEIFGTKSETNAKKYVEYYAEANASFAAKLLPNALEMIQYVSKLGIYQAVLTNKESVVAHNECAVIGMRDYFVEFVGRCDVPNKKPATDGIEMIVDNIRRHHGKGLKPENIWFIGDTMVDVACAGNFDCPMLFVGQEDWIREKYKKYIYAMGDLAFARKMLENACENCI